MWYHLKHTLITKDLKIDNQHHSPILVNSAVSPTPCIQTQVPQETFMTN